MLKAGALVPLTLIEAHLKTVNEHLRKQLQIAKGGGSNARSKNREKSPDDRRK